MWAFSIRLQATEISMTSGGNRAANGPNGRRRKSALPDLHALLRVPIHLIFLFHVEREVERGLIDDHAVDAEFAGAMRIGEKPAARFVVAGFAAPNLRVTEKESLIARKSVERWRALPLQRQFVRAISHRD